MAYHIPPLRKAKKRGEMLLVLLCNCYTEHSTITSSMFCSFKVVTERRLVQLPNILLYSLICTIMHSHMKEAAPGYNSHVCLASSFNSKL